MVVGAAVPVLGRPATAWFERFCLWASLGYSFCWSSWNSYFHLIPCFQCLISSMVLCFHVFLVCQLVRVGLFWGLFHWLHGMIYSMLCYAMCYVFYVWYVLSIYYILLCMVCHAMSWCCLVSTMVLFKGRRRRRSRRIILVGVTCMDRETTVVRLVLDWNLNLQKGRMFDY